MWSAEQPADLVAGEPAPAAVRRAGWPRRAGRRRDRWPARVGAGSRGQRRAAGPWRPAPPGSGTTRSGSAVRRDCARHDVRARPSRRGRRRRAACRRRRRASACRRRVTPARSGTSTDRGHGVRYASTTASSRSSISGSSRRRQLDRRRVDRVDARRRSRRRRGGTICAPSPRYTLYPLSAGGLWLARDHHAGRGPELGDATTPAPASARAGQQHRPHAGAGQHRGRVAGEDVALAAGVVADDDAPLGRRRVGGEQVRDQAAAARRTITPVHAHRPGAERAPQPGGAELQAPGEAVAPARPGRRRAAPAARLRMSASGSAASQPRRSRVTSAWPAVAHRAHRATAVTTP